MVNFLVDPSGHDYLSRVGRLTGWMMVIGS